MPTLILPLFCLLEPVLSFIDCSGPSTTCTKVTIDDALVFIDGFQSLFVDVEMKNIVSVTVNTNEYTLYPKVDCRESSECIVNVDTVSQFIVDCD